MYTSTGLQIVCKKRVLKFVPVKNWLNHDHQFPIKKNYPKLLSKLFVNNFEIIFMISNDLQCCMILQMMVFDCLLSWSSNESPYFVKTYDSINCDRSPSSHVNIRTSGKTKILVVTHLDMDIRLKYATRMLLSANFIPNAQPIDKT